MTYLQDKTILVTGGTGSLGQTLVRRMLSGNEMGSPRKVIVFSRDEAKQHAMKVAWQKQNVMTDDVFYNNFRNRLEFRIGDVRDYADVCSAVKHTDIVVHAAALKQVPVSEYFPMQAVMTNITGAHNIVRAIEEHGYPVQTVIGISTDKACKPVNVMGMTKALQERVFQAANILAPATRFVCVRYGNVLASRGSVIPLFLDQIAQGGPVTITLPEMTRFLMSLDRAVDTVLAALADAKPGETYVPLSPSATVHHIAKALIGERPIDIRINGMRPGEKLHEILVSDEEAHHAYRRDDYYVIRPMLPELAARDEVATPLSGEYGSADHVLDLAGTIELLRSHQLLPEQRERAAAIGQDLLR